MPKILGTKSQTLTLTRSIQSFTVTTQTLPGNDRIDVHPVIEKRDAGSGALVETAAADPYRFAEAEIRAAIKDIDELSDYDSLRIGLAKLMHALIDSRTP